MIELQREHELDSWRQKAQLWRYYREEGANALWVVRDSRAPLASEQPGPMHVYVEPSEKHWFYHEGFEFFFRGVSPEKLDDLPSALGISIIPVLPD